MLSMTWVESVSYTGFKKMVAGQRHYLGAERKQAEIRLLKIMLAERTGERVAAKTGTVHGSIEEFCQHVETMPVTVTWRQTLQYRIRWTRDYMVDCPLAALTRDTVAKWCNTILSRPKSVRFGKPIRAQTSVNMIRAIHQFVQWLDDSGRWTAPAKLEKVFRIRKRFTRSELSDTCRITLLDFALIYKRANDRMRCMLLVALNCGQTQTDLATLQRSHVDAGRLSRARHKTGVAGSWMLWTRTSDALSALPTTSATLQFSTHAGTPLIHYSNSSKVDGITQSFQVACRHAQVKAGFRTIRKLGAQMIRDVGGLEAAQMYLSHAGHSVAEVHYTHPVHENLDAALRAVEMQVYAAIDSA